MKKFQGWDTVCSIFASLLSVVCMSSMGVALAAAGVTGAGLTGMAEMGNMAATPGGALGSLLLAQFFESVGLGSLTQVPNAVAQPLLIASLLISVGASYMAYREHGRLGVLVLTLLSAIAMYVSIYIWMSEPLYFASLLGLLAAAVWGFFLARMLRGLSWPRI